MPLDLSNYEAFCKSFKEPPSRAEYEALMTVFSNVQKFCYVPDEDRSGMSKMIAAAIISAEHNIPLAYTYEKIKANAINPRWLHVCLQFYKAACADDRQNPWFELNTERQEILFSVQTP